MGIGGIAGTPAVEALGLPPPKFPIDTARLTRDIGVYGALSHRALRLKILDLYLQEAIKKSELIIEELETMSD